MKLQLLKKVSKIHAVKCNKSENYPEAVISSNELMRIQNQIESANQEVEFDQIINEIENWANSVPIATQREIEELCRTR